MTASLSSPRLHSLLVVDDQPVNIQVLYQAFAADHRVHKASSGIEALQACRRHRPDLILLDVVMPGMDGFEVCRQLKADIETRDIPVIFVTANNNANQETLGLELGAIDFIVKPVNTSVVRARVKAHLGFARSSSLLAATQEASADGILVTDLAGSISSMNRAFITMWGLPAELQARPTRNGVMACMRQQLIDPGSQQPGWLQAGPPIGTTGAFDVMQLVDNRHVERYVMPLLINGSPRGQVFSFRDVTERWRAAADLQRLNESLETRILERTRELEGAMHLAQTASRAKSDFLSNMSHEIRTPMNAVIGMAFLALKSNPDPQQRGYLEKIHRSGQHLLGLINDVLDFSKIEAGRLDLEAADFLLASVFDSVANQTADVARLKGLKLSFEIDRGLSCPLHGDPLRLGQVLLNYVGNALKFTAQGAVQVRAKAQLRLATETVIRFEVQDTGIGLSEAEIAQLFQTFHQVDTSTTRNHGGTGLGLSICKQLAALMGGEVGVHSQPGLGSTFWFTARVRRGAPVAEPLPAPPLLSQVDARACIQGARILLVEDNVLNQEVAAALLRNAGAVVAVANHGREALEWLAVQPFDCVLMDVQMPVMDGLQATRQLRTNPLFKTLPVLAMTANARSEDGGRCIEAGMSDFLTKPVEPDLLYATLATWLMRRRMAPEPECLANDEAPSMVAPPVPQRPAPDCMTRAVGDASVIDLSILSRSVGGDPQKLRRYASLFVQGLPECIAEFETALQRRELSTLADLGHRMKSSSKLVGALGLASLCESLEGLRHGGTLAQAKAVVDEITYLMAGIAAEMAPVLA